MRIISIEPTPSPNSMKLNLDTALPQGKTYNINKENVHTAPEYIQKCFEVNGVKGIFQVNDFIALERNPKVDWKEILADVRQVFELLGGEVKAVPQEKSEPQQAQDGFGEVEVFLQMFKGIPMQIKLLKNGEESRVGLPEIFIEAARKAQPSAENLITERQWVAQGVRYGEPEEVGQQLVEELSAAYDEERLDKLVAKAFKEEQDEDPDAAFSYAKAEQALENDDWKVRYAALERMELDEENLPLIVKALGDSKLSIRRLATAYLGDIGANYGAEKVMEHLYKALHDDSPVIRRTAGDAISDIGSPLALQEMIQALKDKNKLVRWRAARYMYEVGDETVLDALKSIENDPEFEVSLQAKMAIERIESGGEAEGTVWQQMTRRLQDE